MIRATTGGVMKGYRSNLMNSFINMNKARNTVLSQRNFNSYAEDPAAAAKAFRLRKSRMTVDSQHGICSDTLRKYQAGYSCLQSIDEVLDTSGAIDGSFMNTLHGATLTWLNDPTGDAREQLTKALDQMSESLIQTMNQKYGDNFIFAGADGHNVPFEIKENQLYYRGVPVDAAVPNVVMDGNSPMEINPTTGLTEAGTGTYVKVDTSALISQKAFDNIVKDDPTAVQPQILKQNATPGDPQKFNEKGEPDPNGEYYLNLEKAETISKEDYDKACSDAEKLKYLADEKYFVDIGLGFQENENGKLIESSGFNAALNGINFLGYGLDEDGDPKNLYSLVQKMKEISDSVPADGEWTDDVYDKFHALVKKFELGSSNFKTEFTNMAAGTDKLEINEKLLSDNFYSLQEQYSELEDVDMVDSITSFIWAEYCYNAALKVGNNILSESLMDYLT